MVDTARSLTSLQTLFADNTAGDISEQDLRDFLVTSLMQTSTTTAVTTADITGAIGQVYNLDLSGLTAERNLTLPVASAGDMIQVNVTAGDADYELVIKGVATVTINGGSTATEWSRLFIDGESVTFRATSATNWQVVNDGRIPCVVAISSGSITMSDSVTRGIPFTTVSKDSGSIVSSDTLVMRRYMNNADLSIITTGAESASDTDSIELRVNSTRFCRKPIGIAGGWPTIDSSTSIRDYVVASTIALNTIYTDNSGSGTFSATFTITYKERL